MRLAVWQGIATRIESLTKNYPSVREALPRIDEIAGKGRCSCRNSREHFVTIHTRSGRRSGQLCVRILLLVFVLANPRPLVAAYLALAPDRYRAQAHRTLARIDATNDWPGRAGSPSMASLPGCPSASLLWLIGVQPALMFGVFAFLGEFLPNIGAFLVAIPILLVALSLGATKFWLALGVIVWFTRSS